MVATRRGHFANQSRSCPATVSESGPGAGAAELHTVRCATDGSAFSDAEHDEHLGLARPALSRRDVALDRGPG
jgi:hypothetical protein